MNAPTPALKPPRWPLWLSVPRVELWQAVLLSLSIGPDESLKPEACGAEPRSHLLRGRLPREFFERRGVTLLALSTEGPIRPQGPVYVGMLRDPKCPVALADVAAFLNRAGFNVPSELRPMAEASTPAAPKAADKGNTWLDHVRDYVVKAQQRGRYSTAKQLFAALERSTEEEDSPFEKGTGANRGKLVIRATRGAVAEKTLSNSWQEIREATA